VSLPLASQLMHIMLSIPMADVRARWVFSSETPSSEIAGHTVYDPSKSSTAKELPGATWNISYGDGSSSSGNVYTDTVTVGGTTVTNQAVELAEQVSTQFQQDTDSDGLLGLAFSSINTGMPKSLAWHEIDVDVLKQLHRNRRKLSSTPLSMKVFYRRTSSQQTSRRVRRAPMISASSTLPSTLEALPTFRECNAAI
jgi:hypothetical protein